jgi:condensin complex subunit 1
MDDRVDFDINESLKHYLSDPATIATPEAHSALIECENDPESLTNGLISTVLNPIVDAIAESPDALFRSSLFDSLQFFLKCAPTSLESDQNYPTEPDCELFKLSRSSSLIPAQALSKILDLVVSGLSTEAEIVHQDLEAEEQDGAQNHRHLLEMYGFLLQWTLSAVETKAAERSTTTPAARGRGGNKTTKSKPLVKEGSWDSSLQIQSALDVMCRVLKLKLGKIFLTTSERDTFVNLFTRPVYLIMESEQRLKSTAIRMHAFKVLCIAVKHHGHAFGRVKVTAVIKQTNAPHQEPKRRSFRISPILSISRNQWPNSYTSCRSSTIIRSLRTRY